MGNWNFYFIAKLALYAGGYIGFHFMANLVFAALLLIPVGAKWWRAVRTVTALPAAFALLYHDSYLPSLARIAAQASYLEGFSPEYFVEIGSRFVSLTVVGALLVLFFVYWLLNKILRITTIVLLAMISVPAAQGLMKEEGDPLSVAAGDEAQPTASDGNSATPTRVSLDAQLEKFRQQERARQALFPKTGEYDENFDVIFIHACSLSWDDLKVSHKEDHPVFRRWDLLFRNFNSAASYSGPAAIRLLRGSCGQTDHTGIYGDAPKECYTFQHLAAAGFEPQVLMNHEGRYGHFLEDVQRRGGLSAAPQPQDRSSIAMRAFDGSPIYSDYAVLAHWWKERLAKGPKQVALYYNTISLHDGNRLISQASAPSLRTYPTRLQNLLDDVDRFLRLLEQSGRKVVVVFVPEHGAALRGDKVQIAGMREIPSARITLVPVGVKWIGADAGSSPEPIAIKRPVSYLAISQLLADTMAERAFNGRFDLKSAVGRLPRTEFVAENEGTIVMQSRGAYYIRAPEGDWVRDDLSR